MNHADHPPTHAQAKFMNWSIGFPLVEQHLQIGIVLRPLKRKFRLTPLALQMDQINKNKR